MIKTKLMSHLMAGVFVATAVAAPQVFAAGEVNKTAQKAGAYIDDSVITAKVKAAFVEDKQISALKINVTTKAGVVTLKGAVPSAEMGQHALQIAAGIEGVTDVKSDLTVKAG